jgi:flagellar motor switch protein FliM
VANNILDQAEIDALLNAAQTEEESAAGGSGTGISIRPYAFQPPDLISRTQFRGLFSLHESFVRELQSSLSLLLRSRVEMRLVSVDQQRFVDFATSLDQFTNIHMFDAKPLPGTALVDFSMPVIFGILDHQLGGDGTGKLPQRALTAVETAIIEPILKMFFRGLQDALSAEVPVEIQRLRTETSAEYAHIDAPEAPVVAVCIDVEVGSVNGLINICYPAPMVASVLWEQQSKANVHEEKAEDPEDLENRKIMMTRMMDVPLSLPVVLGELHLSTRDWLALKVGDVLVLPRRLHEPVTVKVEDIPLYHARPGRVGNTRSVRILRSVNEGRKNEVSHLVR